MPPRPPPSSSCAGGRSCKGGWGWVGTALVGGGERGMGWDCSGGWATVWHVAQAGLIQLSRLHTLKLRPSFRDGQVPDATMRVSASPSPSRCSVTEVAHRDIGVIAQLTRTPRTSLLPQREEGGAAAHRDDGGQVRGPRPRGGTGGGTLTTRKPAASSGRADGRGAAAARL